MRSPARVIGAAILVCEALVVVFAGLVAKDLSGLESATALTLAGALALTCLVAAALLRGRAGFVLGSAVQVAVIAAGVVVPVMYVLGVLFAMLWVAGLVAARRAAGSGRERGVGVERVDRAAGEGNHPGQAGA